MPEIKTTMTADTSQFERAMKRSQSAANKTSRSVTSGFGKVSSAFGSIVSKAGAVGLAVGTVSAALAAISGKNIDLARASFEKLASSFNANSDVLLSKLKEVSHGMVSDFDLIQAASRAMVLGLKPDAIVSYLEIAAASSKATGQTMTEAFNDITIGVARQSRMILDNLGIIVDSESAYKKYADQLGIAASALTDVQKQQAFQNAVMEAGQRQVKILGSDTEHVMTNTAELLTRLTNTWTNFATSAGKALNVVAGGLMNVYDWLFKVNAGATDLAGNPYFNVAAEEKELRAALATNVSMTDHTTPLNGNGVQAKQDQADIVKKQAKELDSIYKSISDTIDKYTKSDTQLINEEYDKRSKAAQGNADLLKKIEEARQFELTAHEEESQEVAKAFLDEQRKELLSRREQELEELQAWYEQVAELEGITNEQRLEATAIFEDRKAQIADEARQKDLEASKHIEEQKAALADEEARKKKESLQRQTDMIQSFGTTALQLGAAIGSENFKMQQGLAAGQAIMDTHAAVMKTMASVPYPFNIPLAAAQAAIGAAHVASILSASPDGGGDVGSVSGGGSAAGGGAGPNVGSVTPTSPQAEEKTGTYTINIMGDIMNEDYVDLLAEKISDAVQDRNVILKASTARNVRG